MNAIAFVPLKCLSHNWVFLFFLFLSFFLNKHHWKHFIRISHFCLFVRHYISTDVGPKCASLGFSLFVIFILAFFQTIVQPWRIVLIRERSLRGFAVLHDLCRQAGSFLFVFLSGQGHVHIMSIGIQKFVDWGWAQISFSP